MTKATPVRRLTWFVAVASLCVAACLPRYRFNKQCQWTGDLPRPLDLQDARDRRHLVEDAQLAEELGMRYSDFKHKELTGYEGHGGYLQQGAVTRGCMEKMFNEIERAHGVTREQIFAARMQRDWRFDAAVIGSFAGLYLLGTIAACRLLARRFSHRGARVWIAAVVLISIAATLTGVQLLELWALAAESFRVGNDHLGATRAAKSPWFDPWHRHLLMLFVSGVLVFWIAAWRYRPLDEANEPTLPDTGPQGIVLH